MDYFYYEKQFSAFILIFLQLRSNLMLASPFGNEEIISRMNALLVEWSLCITMEASSYKSW